MDRFYYLCSMTLLHLFQRNGKTIFACPVTMTNQTLFEEITVQENTQANFSYHLRTETSETVNDDMFAFEIKLCDNGSYYGLCKCRWIFEKKEICKHQRNLVTCDVYNSEIRVSLLVKRTYSDIMWELYRQDSTPRVVKLTTLQVTYPAKVTGLQVNGREVNETDVINENQEVSVSCSFINGKPPVIVRLLDQTGHAHSSTRHGRSPLTLSLGDFRCHDVWPTIRCEAPGSELNRSVSVLGRCLPQFLHTETQVVSLAQVLEEGMTLRLKSYTSNIRKCHMTKLFSQPYNSDVKCKVSGSAPEFNLTLLFSVESRIGVGIWTLHVTTELGSSNITFVLTNNTAQPGDLRPVMTTGNNILRTTTRKCRGVRFTPQLRHVSKKYQDWCHKNVFKYSRLHCFPLKVIFLDSNAHFYPYLPWFYAFLEGLRGYGPLDDLHDFKTGHLDDLFKFGEKEKITQSQIR